MPVPDHGGFDLSIAVAEATIAAIARSRPLPPSAPTNVTLAQWTGQSIPKVAIADVKLSAPDRVTLSLDLTGSTLKATAIVINGITLPVPAWMQTVSIAGIVRLTDRIEGRARSVVVDFAPDATRSQPDVAVELDEDGLFASPLIQLWLAQIILLNPSDGTAYDKARANLAAQVKQEIAAATRQQAQSLGVVTLVTPPAGLPITATSFRVGNQELQVLFSLGGAPGNPAAITRSNLLRNTATGVPADVAAVILSNACLLRDFVCPAVMGALGLPAAGLVAGQPCLFVGPTALTAPGGPFSGAGGITLNTIMAGVDEAQLLHVVVGLTATDAVGTFTVNCTVDTAFTVVATTAPGGGGAVMTIAAAGAPVVTSDVVIPLWVYAVAALTGGAYLATVLLAIDAFAGPLLNGAIGAAVGPRLPTFTVTVPAPAGAPAVSVRTSSLNQVDAPRRTLAIGPISIPAPFRDHDLVVNLI